MSRYCLRLRKFLLRSNTLFIDNQADQICPEQMLETLHKKNQYPKAKMDVVDNALTAGNNK